MMKFIYTMMALIFATNYGHGSSNINGNFGYYEINTNPAVTRSVLDRLEPQSQGQGLCLAAIRRSLRPEVKIELSINEIFDVARKTGGIDFAAARASMERPNQSEDEQIGTVWSLCAPEHQDSFLAQIAAKKSEKKGFSEKYRTQYACLGNQDLSQIRDFINTELLNLEGERRINPAEAEDLFQTLKSIGFLRTAIPTTQGFTYSQTIAAQEFISNHPDVHTLVLGCGSFVDQDTHESLFGSRQAGLCGTCQCAHHISKGEMTVALNNGGGSGHPYADVIGDMTSREFWIGLKNGLTPGRVLRIVDHSETGLKYWVKRVADEILGEAAYFED